MPPTPSTVVLLLLPLLLLPVLLLLLLLLRAALALALPASQQPHHVLVEEQCDRRLGDDAHQRGQQACGEGEQRWWRSGVGRLEVLVGRRGAALRALASCGFAC